MSLAELRLPCPRTRQCQLFPVRTVSDNTLIQSSSDPHEHRVPLYDLQYQLVILGVSISAFEHKVHIRCSDVSPRDGVVRLNADSMRIFRYIDTYVGCHVFDVGGIRQPLEVHNALSSDRRREDVESGRGAQSTLLEG